MERLSWKHWPIKLQYSDALSWALKIICYSLIFNAIQRFFYHHNNMQRQDKRVTSIFVLLNVFLKCALTWLVDAIADYAVDSFRGQPAVIFLCRRLYTMQQSCVVFIENSTMVLVLVLSQGYCSTKLILERVYSWGSKLTSCTRQHILCIVLHRPLRGMSCRGMR